MSEWKKETLRDVVVKISDRDHFTPTYVEVGIPMISPKDIKINERIDFSNCKYITEEAHLQNRKKTDLKAGDLVFTRIGALLGKICIVEDWMPEFSILHSAAMIRANESFITPEYLMYFIKSNYFQSQIRNEIQSIGVPDLGLDKINQFKINYPTDKIVQKKIAKILINCDTVIEQTQSAITKYKAIKQGLLHDLFTRGLDANGHLRPSYKQAPELYKESELGMIPKEWEVKEFKELIKSINSGWSPVCLVEPASVGEWGSLKTTAVTWDGYNPRENKKLPNDLLPREETEVEIDDFLITRVGPRDRVGVIVHVDDGRRKLMVSDNMLRVKIFKDESLLLPFLALIMGSSFVQKEWIRKIAGLAEAQVVINQQVIRQTIFPLPRKDEQKAIFEKTNCIKKKIQIEENLLQKYQAIKRGLMGDLLGGRKEVKN